MDLLPSDWLYAILLFIHIGAAIVGFGSTFVWPFLASRMTDADPGTRLLVSRAAATGGTVLSGAFIIASGVAGIILVPISLQWDFSQMWVSIAFVLFFAIVIVSLFLVKPNQARMVELQEELASGAADGTGSPPPQVAELAERGKKSAMFGGILHLLFVLILADMILKPGEVFFN